MTTLSQRLKNTAETMRRWISGITGLRLVSIVKLHLESLTMSIKIDEGQRKRNRMLFYKKKRTQRSKIKRYQKRM